MTAIGSVKFVFTSYSFLLFIHHSNISENCRVRLLYCVIALYKHYDMGVTNPRTVGTLLTFLHVMVQRTDYIRYL